MTDLERAAHDYRHANAEVEALQREENNLRALMGACRERRHTAESEAMRCSRILSLVATGMSYAAACAYRDPMSPMGSCEIREQVAPRASAA